MAIVFASWGKRGIRVGEQRKHSVLRVTIGLSIVSFVAKMLGFVREQVIAWRFGATAGVDSYVAALSVPQILATIVGGAIASAFLPVYTAERSKNEKSAAQVAGTALYLTVFFSLLGAMLSFVLAPGAIRVIAGQFPADQQALAVLLLRIMSVGTVLLGLSTFLTMLLNAHRQFLWPALTPLVSNGVIVVGLILAGAYGVGGLAWLTTASMALPITLLLAVAWVSKVRVFVLPDFRHPAIVKIGKLSAPILASSLFGQVYIMIDRFLASGLDEGSMAALNYALKLVQLPVGVFVTALATAVYPALADCAAAGDRRSFSATVASSLRGLLMLLIPATVGMFVLRYPIVQLAFERGSFDSAATAKTATALGFFSFGILGMAAGQILARAFYSLQETLTPVLIGIATAIVNIVLDLLLVKPMGQGGLALASALGFIFHATFMLWFLSRRLEPGSLNLWGTLLKVGLASSVVGVSSHATFSALAGHGSITALLAAVTVGVALYAVCLVVLRVEGVPLLRSAR